MVDLDKYRGWALITGASSGIGAEFARSIAGTGVNCVLVARRLERLKKLAAELTSATNAECRCVKQDLTEDGFADRLRAATDDVPVGILVNNAGAGYSGQFETRDPDRMAQMICLNCTAPVVLTRAYLPDMLARGVGAVINIASISSFLPVPFDAVYGATKAFNLHFGEALWAELYGRGIDVLNVCPNLTRTEFFTAEGMGENVALTAAAKSQDPAEVARIALDSLGKKTTVSPWSTAACAFITRFVPRRTLCRFMRRYMADLHPDQVSLD